MPNPDFVTIPQFNMTLNIDNVSFPLTSSRTFPNANGINIQNPLASDTFNESIWKALEFNSDESNSSAPSPWVTTHSKDEDSSSGFGLFLLAFGLAIFILMSLVSQF